MSLFPSPPPPTPSFLQQGSEEGPRLSTMQSPPPPPPAALKPSSRRSVEIDEAGESWSASGTPAVASSEDHALSTVAAGVSSSSSLPKPPPPPASKKPALVGRPLSGVSVTAAPSVPKPSQQQNRAPPVRAIAEDEEENEGDSLSSSHVAQADSQAGTPWDALPPPPIELLGDLPSTHEPGLFQSSSSPLTVTLPSAGQASLDASTLKPAVNRISMRPSPPQIPPIPTPPSASLSSYPQQHTLSPSKSTKRPLSGLAGSSSQSSARPHPSQIQNSGAVSEAIAEEEGQSAAKHAPQNTTTSVACARPHVAIPPPPPPRPKPAARPLSSRPPSGTPAFLPKSFSLLKQASGSFSEDQEEDLDQSAATQGSKPKDTSASSAPPKAKARPPRPAPPSSAPGAAPAAGSISPAAIASAALSSQTPRRHDLFRGLFSIPPARILERCLFRESFSSSDDRADEVFWGGGLFDLAAVDREAADFRAMVLALRKKVPYNDPDAYGFLKSRVFPPSPMSSVSTSTSNCPMPWTSTFKSTATQMKIDVYLSSSSRCDPISISLSPSASLADLLKTVVQQATIRGVTPPPSPVLKVLGRAEYLDAPPATAICK